MKSFLASSLVFAMICVGGGSLVRQAPEKASAKSNPYEGDESARKAGEKLYRQECASCHGADRQGWKKAPPLNRPDIEKAPAGALFWALRNGAPFHGMPSFAHLPDEQKWEIVTFLRVRQ